MDIAIIGVLVLMIVLCFIFFMRRRGTDIMIGIIGLTVLLVLAYFFLSNIQCRKLKKYGFGYEQTGGASPTWDIVMFFFKRANGKKIEGPRIAGSCLKVRCRDIDKDGVPEFVIQSRVIEPYQTILKVDIKSGNYHVHYTEGLKVSYPEEGFYY